MPSWAKAVLQEMVSASSRLCRPLGSHAEPPKFSSAVLVPGRTSSWGAGMTVSGVYWPLDSAAAETTTLKIDPGS
jgi:hypothetical protein